MQLLLASVFMLMSRHVNDNHVLYKFILYRREVQNTAARVQGLDVSGDACCCCCQHCCLLHECSSWCSINGNGSLVQHQWQHQCINGSINAAWQHGSNAAWQHQCSINGSLVQHQWLWCSINGVGALRFSPMSFITLPVLLAQWL
jgi:hypothetical protein